MKNLLLVTFSWLMMIAIVGSIVYTMLYVVENYSSGNNEAIQYLWCCFTGVLLIPAYKGVFYIHSLWIKTLKEFREAGDPVEDDSKEIPFFKEPAPVVSVNITEYPFVENRKKNIPAPPSLDEINEKIKNIRSSANEKLSQIKTEDISKPTKDSSYFAQKYTGEKSILVDTIFGNEKQTTTSQAESILKPKAEPTTQPKVETKTAATAKVETKATAKVETETATAPKSETKATAKVETETATAPKSETKATAKVETETTTTPKSETQEVSHEEPEKHAHKGGKKHYHKKGSGKR